MLNVNAPTQDRSPQLGVLWCHRLSSVAKESPLWPVLSISILGIILDKTIGTPGSFGLLSLALCSLINTFFLRFRTKHDLRAHSIPAQLRIGLLLLLGATFGFYSGALRGATDTKILHWQKILERSSLELNSLQWSPIVLKGTITERVRYRQASSNGFESTDSSGEDKSQMQSLTLLEITHFRDRDRWVRADATTPVTVNERVENLFPGDVVQVFGQWKLPTFAGNPGQYDQASRYAELGYSAQVRVSSADQISKLHPNGSPFRPDRYFAQLGSIALEAIESHVPFGQSDLAAALLLGQRDMVQWRLQEDLLATGSIHMLSISGMHIEMIAISLLILGTICQIRQTPLLISVCLLVWSYTLVCGTNPPVLRASIMLTAGTIGQAFGWKSFSMNNLALAGLILVTLRPSILFETGTQLSFLAVAVLIVAGARLVRHPTPLRSLIHARQPLHQRRARRAIHFCYDMLRSSFWVWFITAPLVWGVFHVLSPIAIPLNLVLWLPMLVALLTGLGLVLVGWIPIVGAPLGLLCGGMLYVVDSSVELANRVPYGHFWSSAPPTWWMAGFYVAALVCVAILGTRTARSRRRIVAILLGWFALGGAYLHALQPIGALVHPPRLQITFIDVGHGCHAWIRYPDGKLWCYDAGRMGDHERSYRVMVDALWADRTLGIDTLALSHGDSDHYNGMPGIADRFAIRRFVTTSSVLSHADPLVRNAVDHVARKAGYVETFKQGMKEQIAGCDVSVLHPDGEENFPPGASDNAKSLCLLIEFAGRRIFLPGDIEPPGTDKIVAQPPVPIDILLAPHHGSLRSEGERIARWGDAKHIVVSGSLRSLSPKVVQLYSLPEARSGPTDRKLWFTARDRAIRFTILGSGLIEIETWRSNRWQGLPSLGVDDQFDATIGKSAGGGLVIP